MLEIIATIFSILGAGFNARKRIEGLIFWCVANPLWIIYGFISKQYFLTLNFTVYFIITLYGLYYWKKIKK